MRGSSVVLYREFATFLKFHRFTASKKKKCLEALFKGKDVYASLPTGYEKSLIFYAAPIRDRRR